MAKGIGVDSGCREMIDDADADFKYLLFPGILLVELRKGNRSEGSKVLM